MQQSTYHHETQSGTRLVFPWHLPLSARLVTGGLLLPFALFFGYYAFSGLVEYIRYATWQEWISSIPGFILMLALTLVFAVPAWFSFLGKGWVTVDKAQGTIEAVRDWAIYKQRRQYALADAHCVMLTEEIKSNERGTRVSYTVQIMIGKNTAVLLYFTDNETEAETFAASAANSLALPVQTQRQQL
ncbi:MAG: hypothetical protein R3E31_19775 [Chloroflexota bacterium]|nr:hypothetical protein [Ardenticatenaceae bacterium]